MVKSWTRSGAAAVLLLVLFGVAQLGSAAPVPTTPAPTTTEPDPCGLGLIPINPPFSFKAGSRAPVCVLVGRLTADTNLSLEERFVPLNKTLFWPKVDEFSLIEITGSEDAGLGDIDDDTAAIQVQVGHSLSPVRRRSDGNFVVPFWTLVQILDHGRPDYSQWDGGCLGCENDRLRCLDGTCGEPVQRCSSRLGSVNCNLKIYVSWFGQDRAGRYMVSAGQRLSRFRSWSIASTWNSAKSDFNNIQPPGGVNP